jgi:hypothetical protein
VKSSTVSVIGTYGSSTDTFVVAVYGQAVTGTYSSSGVSFKVPTRIGKGALVVYENGIPSNACPFQITAN